MYLFRTSLSVGTRWRLTRQGGKYHPRACLGAMDNDYYSIEAILAENQVGQYNITIVIV